MFNTIYLSDFSVSGTTLGSEDRYLFVKAIVIEILLVIMVMFEY